MAIPLAIGYFCDRLSRSLVGDASTWRARLLWAASREANQLALVAVAIVLMVLSLVMTLCRSAIISLAAASILFGAVIIRRAAGRLRPALVAVVLAVIGVAVGLTATDTVIDRFAVIEPGWDGRHPLWRETLQIIRRFPLVGTGFNTYVTAMTLHPSPQTVPLVVAAHNDYLQLAAEGGVLLTGAAAILAAVFVRRTRGRLRECAASSMDYWIRVGAVMGLLAIAIQELAEFSLQIPGNATLFVVMCALAVHSSDPPRAPAMVRVPRATTRRGPLRSCRLVFRETVVRFW